MTKAGRAVAADDCAKRGVGVNCRCGVASVPSGPSPCRLATRKRDGAGVWIALRSAGFVLGGGGAEMCCRGGENSQREGEAPSLLPVLDRESKTKLRQRRSGGQWPWLICVR